jgi:hypothetical protein
VLQAGPKEYIDAPHLAEPHHQPFCVWQRVGKGQMFLGPPRGVKTSGIKNPRRALLFDRHHQRKPAMESVVSRLQTKSENLSLRLIGVPRFQAGIDASRVRIGAKETGNQARPWVESQRRR